jgi:hypothetical protein
MANLSRRAARAQCNMSDNELDDDEIEDMAPQLEARVSGVATLKNLPRLRHKDRVFLLKGAIVAAKRAPTVNTDTDLQDDGKTVFFSLPHPRLKSTLRYMRSQRRVLEIQACRSGPSSWFINESVLSGVLISLSVPPC